MSLLIRYEITVYGIHAKDESVSPFLSQALSEGRVIYSSSGSVSV